MNFSEEFRIKLIPYCKIYAQFTEIDKKHVILDYKLIARKQGYRNFVGYVGDGMNDY